MTRIEIRFFKCPECKRLFSDVNASGTATAAANRPDACDCGSVLEDCDRVADFEIGDAWIADFRSGMDAAKSVLSLNMIVDELRADGILEPNPPPGAARLAGVVSPLGNVLEQVRAAVAQ